MGRLRPWLLQRHSPPLLLLSIASPCPFAARRIERGRVRALLRLRMHQRLCSCTPSSVRAGKYGAFLGDSGSCFAVVEATGCLGAVFHTASTSHANAVPLYTFDLSGCSLLGCAMPLFAGPPSSFQVRARVGGCVAVAVAMGGVGGGGRWRDSGGKGGVEEEA